MQESRKREIRKQANAFRERCKISRYGIIDLFKDCERLGYKVIRYPLGDMADLGFVTKKDKDTIIFTNTNSRLAREIFTLAHEIGHAELHMDKEVSFVDDALTISAKSADVKEQEANYFASCLLMPDDEVNKFLDIEIVDFNENGLTALDIARIMSEFNVSFEMALNRLENIGKINESEKVSLDTQRIHARVGNLLRSVGGNRRLNEASKETEIPHDYMEDAIYNYNHSAIPLETLEKTLECYNLTIDDVIDQVTLKENTNDEDLDALIGGEDA